MGVLDWGKPSKKLTYDQWSRISADGAPPGVYTPNMSDADASKWRAKLVKGGNPRIEVRTLKGSQMLMIVYADGSVRLSMNGPVELTLHDWVVMQAAFQEALDALKDAGCVSHQ